MLHPDKKTIGRGSQQAAADLFFVAYINSALAMENELNGRGYINIVLSCPGIDLAQYFCHQVQVCLPVVLIFFWQHELPDRNTVINCIAIV